MNKKIKSNTLIEKRLNSNKSPIQVPSDNSFYVVGIGASAGGLEALEGFFRNMPENSGMAFIVVSHLDPTRISIMPELLQKSTSMKLLQAVDGMLLKPDHVYVAPPNRDLGILHGTIQLIEPLEAHGFRHPIDFFFKSLSEDSGEKAVSIILSGMGSDGSTGLKAVKSELGMVMVQDPKTAKYDGMPVSAVSTGLADYVLPVEEMPVLLIKYTSQKIKGVLLDKAITEGKLPNAFQKIFILLRTHTGHDFSLYKQSTIYRRVERRMVISQLDNLSNYIRLLQENPEETESLFKELLIGVTNFFRDPESFDKLKIMLSEIVKSKPDNGQIRIWVPGCSTGEEAYSIAIILHECLDEIKKRLNIQIFATDIDNNAIEKARIGTYYGIAQDLSTERLNRYFSVDGNLFHVKKEIREMVVFAPQSIIKDPPFTKLDLLSCRNLLIYLDSALQKKIIPLFHYSLLPDGILFLGSSETISGFVDLFSIADNKWKIYKRRASVLSAQPFIEFPVSRTINKPFETIIKKTEVKNITQLAEKVILKYYAPNCVIINEKGEITYIYGRTGKYLELMNGEAKMNIFEMAREGLQQELPALVRKASTQKKTLTVDGIKVKINGHSQLINLTVKPIKEPESMSGSFLIIFEDIQPAKNKSASKKTRNEKKSGNIIKELERELNSTKENLKTIIEELEASNEELKSTNEEFQSTNEEIQSSNEELETSKEEMQSLNEELITLNTELMNKNDELSVINSDMKNLVNSIDIPTVFLDNDLCIKRFTYNITKAVNIIKSDIGRPINHIATNLKYENLVEDSKEVLRTLIYKEIELQTNDGTWYQMKILPYRTTNNVIDGVVITFSNIHKIKTANEEINKLNQEIQLAREYADNIIQTVREALIVLDPDLKVLSANRSFYRTFNATEEKTVGKFIYELDDKKWEIPELRVLLEHIIPQNNFFEDFEVEYDFADAGKKKMLLNARRMIYQGEKETKLILLAIRQQDS